MADHLADELLRLENLLTRDGAAIVPLMHQGIAESLIEGALDSVGLVPTSEVVTWFGWHDGAGERGLPSSSIELIPGGEFYDLAYLCSKYDEMRHDSEEAASMSGGALAAHRLWRASWFPLLRLFGKGYLAADLAGGPESPVHVVWFDDDPDRRATVAWPSMTAFVKAIIERFNANVYSFDADGIVQGPTIDLPG